MLGPAVKLLESPINETLVMYENYRGTPAGEGWAAWW